VALTCRSFSSFVRRELRNEMMRASDELRHHLKMRSNLLRVRVWMLLVASVGSISDFLLRASSSHCGRRRPALHGEELDAR
jgi:hypothetical protein